jgi:hypothetical protein
MTMGFRVVDASTHATLPGIPTPRLIEAGGGEAFFKAPENPQYKGVWYIHEEPNHVSPDGTYTRVRIYHTEGYAVEVEVTVTGDDEQDNYRDEFFVDAIGEQDAQSLAAAECRRDVEDRYGDVATDIRFIRTHRGGLR